MPLDLARIRAVCFDVDGTLSDTDDQWTEQLAGRLRPVAKLLPRGDSQSFARKVIMSAETPGNIAYQMLDWARLDAPLIGLLGTIARLRGPQQRSLRLVPGVDELLPDLAARFSLAVISANREENTLAFLNYFHLRPYFHCVATGLTCEHTKPFPDPVLWCAQQMGVSPAECLMVGDTTVDIRAGRSAGAQTVGVLCGFGEEKELRAAGANHILNTTAELRILLAQIP